jgi:2-isopropylmalate synthase
VIHGARQVECTINGIGERAGNTSLEEIVMILKSHELLPFETRIRPARLCPASDLVSRLMRMPVQANKAIVGKNAFAHSSGIHQDGFLKHAGNYEIIDPKTVGAGASSIVLTARSGRAALNHHLKALGYTYVKEDLDEFYSKFLVLADKAKHITSDDLHRIAETFKPIEQ